MTVTFALALIFLAAAPALAALGARAGSVAGALGCLLLLVTGVAAVLGHDHPALNLGGWVGFGSSELRVDGLAGIFLALTGLTGCAVSLAGADLPAGRWLSALGSVLMLAVTLTITTTNAFLFLLAWELLSVCVYLISSAGCQRPQDLVAGYLSGGLAKVGGAALLAAIGLLYAHTHSFDVTVWAHSSLPGGTRGLLFILFLAAFATKVGVVPLQGALPAGYGAGPRLGAALQSVALGAGFYGLWRFGFEVLRPLPTWCGDALLILGGVTAILGIVYALTQDDQRRFLGYSTVEHTGIAMVGLAVALLGESAHQPKLAAVGLLAATLEVCAHNLAKTLALISIDRVQVATGERRIDPLGGLARRVPLSSAGLGAACVTLAAIPPLGGFVSEWFTFEALLQGFRMPTLLSRLLCALAAAALALTAGVGLLAFAKYLGFICLGPARERRGRVGEPGRWPVGLVVLGVVVVALGALAPWEIQALGDGLRGALGFDAGRASVTHPLVLGPVFADFSVLAPTWLAIVLPSYALIAIGVARGLGRGAVRRAPVWVAGSGAELASVQYRPSAFSNPMRVILRGPLGYRARVADQGEPPVDVLQTRVVLAVDRFFYAPLSRLALALASIVRRFQSGRLSMYLLYMLIAVLAALSLIPILR